VLRLKAAKSFLETCQCNHEHNNVEVQKNPDYEMGRENFIWDWQRSRLKNLDKSNIFIKKNVKNNSSHQFYLVCEKIRINQVLLYFNP